MGLVRRNLIISGLLIGGLVAVLGTVAGHQLLERRREAALEADVEAARQAAEEGNMGQIRKLLARHPGHEAFAAARTACFEAIRGEYSPLDAEREDKAYESILGTRVRAEGVCVKAMEELGDGGLWSCIRVPAEEGEGRFIQLYFEAGEYTAEELETLGLRPGRRVRAYGILERIDKKLLREDEWGLRPVEVVEGK